MYANLASILQKTFATDQNSYLLQQSDGNYRKKTGTVTAKRIEKMLEEKSSIAVLQKNTDFTVKWICFDFDILKPIIESGDLSTANEELIRYVGKFCEGLKGIGISHLLEFSGNRGVHVWVTLTESISHRAAFEIHQEILDRLQLTYNDQLVGLDLFPKTPNPTTGIGNGVKLPCSLHTKSNNYALIIDSHTDFSTDSIRVSTLSEELIKKMTSILTNHRPMTKSELEIRLHISIDDLDEVRIDSPRIRNIKIRAKGFTQTELFAKWKLSAPFECLTRKLENGKVSHEERKLIVGLLCNLKTEGNDGNFSSNILHSIFSLTSNYDKDRTDKAIRQLASFSFPSQEQIESITGAKFTEVMTLDGLLNAALPGYESYLHANFDLCLKDIEITRIAELNYLFSNDEAQSRLVINELSTGEADDIFVDVNELLHDQSSLKFYKHIRQETEKTRTLVTLGSVGRVATSAVIKQLIHFLDPQTSPNTFGYRINKGFAKGQIFQPWLYKWLEFTGNIESAISDPDYADHYIVKTDIRKYYDEIPHDSLKRLLLGGDIGNISTKLKSLPASEKNRYVECIDFLFSINKKVVDGVKGLPQGPAYARWLAEVYLSSLDEIFEPYLDSGDVQLYQRYVDDIFFISANEKLAAQILDRVKTHLENLGLSLNLEKTTVKQIGSFGVEFDKYRSQSKYAVDRASRNFEDATDAEKNNAISEFLKIIHSDGCNDDLAFIYSHLTGIDDFDKWKKEKAPLVINSQVGRGSLYKHLFGFLIEDPSNWSEFNKVEVFSQLQSEVLTSILLDFLVENKAILNDIRSTIDLILAKLHWTPMVEEHVAFLLLSFGHDGDIKQIQPSRFVNCLASPVDLTQLNISNELLTYINTEINNIQSLRQFIRVLYSLCASNTIDKKGLNELAPVFIAKISSDHRAGRLGVTDGVSLCTQSLVAKFHFLTCLYSVSNFNSSDDLLHAIWTYCIHIHNLYGSSSLSSVGASWLRKIDDIDLDPQKAMLILSAKLDGNIVRGIEDNCKIFERYHSALLVYFALNSKIEDILSIENQLSELAGKAVFYKWLIEDFKNVKFFPSNREWFEKNLIKNDLILLRRGSQILIRRAEGDFSKGANPQNIHQGYGEIIIPFDPNESNSLAMALDAKSTSSKLELLSRHLAMYSSLGCFPNIFTSDYALMKDAITPISDELLSCRYLVFEAKGDVVDALENNEKNFLSCFFSVDRSLPTEPSFRYIHEKYIKNLEKNVGHATFTSNFVKNIPTTASDLDEFLIDVIAAATAYACVCEGVDTYLKLENFVRQYHKFGSDEIARHIYAIDEDTVLNAQNPAALLGSVKYSLGLIRTKVFPALPFFLDKDVEAYTTTIESILYDMAPQSPIDIESLKPINVIAKPYSGVVSIDHKDYEFQNVFIISSQTQNIEVVGSKYVPYINSTQDVYAHIQGENAYLLLIPGSISKIYSALKARLEKIFNGKPTCSYPKITGNFLDSIKLLAGYRDAIQNIAEHRGLSNANAEELLNRWLKSMPTAMHQTLVTLIAAHVVMKKDEIIEFLSQVKSLMQCSDANPFSIKQLEDMGGTQRLLIADGDINRKLACLNPLHIENGAIQATVVVDNIITGTQIISAFKHYLSLEGDHSKNGYFVLTQEQRKSVASKLLGLKRIRICTVLYTQKALLRIRTELQELISPDLQVEIAFGRDMGGDAFFESTSKIGAADKEIIRSVLTDAEQMESLRVRLKRLPNGKLGRAMNHAGINSANLVARYQSLPKKAFWFLSTGLLADPTCHPFIRIPEAHEIKSS